MPISLNNILEAIWLEAEYQHFLEKAAAYPARYMAMECPSDSRMLFCFSIQDQYPLDFWKIGNVDFEPVGECLDEEMFE